MIEELKKLFIRFNYTDENGLIINTLSLKEGVHLSVGFDNKRKEFNVHFTNDRPENKSEKRRNYIFVISAFRFFLFAKRFEGFYNFYFLDLLCSSKINLGKLKKHKFIINTFFSSEGAEEQIIQKRKNGKNWRFRRDINRDLIADGFKYIDSKEDISKDFNTVYKIRKGNLVLQGYIFKNEHLGDVFFIPKKSWNKFNKFMATTIYNYLNACPTQETYQLREMLFENLKSVH